VAFFREKKGDCERAIESACASATARVHVWYESPQRIGAALTLVADAVPDAETVAGKELTKLHEKLFWGSASEVCQQVADEIEREGERGEWCFAVRFPEVQKESSDWVEELSAMLAEGASVSDAARKISQQFGIARKRVYETALDQKKIKNR
jgi:16S rRNA (cytidine1402-2'-O)-methyltransferase